MQLSNTCQKWSWLNARPWHRFIATMLMYSNRKNEGQQILVSPHWIKWKTSHSKFGFAFSFENHMFYDGVFQNLAFYSRVGPKVPRKGSTRYLKWCTFLSRNCCGFFFFSAVVFLFLLVPLPRFFVRFLGSCFCFASLFSSLLLMLSLLPETSSSAAG